MTNNDLEPLSSEEALDLYLRDKRTDLAESSLKAHKYRLGHFIRWCKGEGEISNLNTLSGRDIHRYKLWRREDGDLNKVSIKTQMDTLRVFIRWCESVDAVQPDLQTKVLSPDLNRGENQRDVKLDTEAALELLDYLDRFHYASFEHVVLTLLWRSGMRIGAVHGLDIQDYDSSNYRLQACHRPKTGTPLKNKDSGERLIALSAETCHLLDDWLAHQRPDVTDDHGREPLLATTHGRAHKTTIRVTVYRWTRPCTYTGACPHNRDPENCEAMNGKRSSASRCPSSVSPHALRRGAITHHLTQEIPEKVVSDRMNVGQQVLEKHYDRRSEEVKVEQRRDYLDNL